MDRSWNEDDSALYQKLADVAVPRREAQIATLLTLAPMTRDERCRVVEFGCGTGALSFALLEAFAHCELTALDGSESMLTRTRSHLASYGDRVNTRPFTLEAPDWHHHLDGATLAVSSLTLHHLGEYGKRALFEKAARALDSEGALLVADLVAPQRSEAEALFRSSWDRSAHKRAARIDPSRYALFERERWNIYRHPDPADKPSPLFDQLKWLSEAGFAVVDCFWLQAGHAIYGGYRSGKNRHASAIEYGEALTIARRAVGTSLRASRK